LVLVLLFSDVHPIGSATADPIAVDIVTSEEVAERLPEPVPAPETRPAFDLLKPTPPNLSDAAPAPTPASTPPASPPPASAPQTASRKAAPPPAPPQSPASQAAPPPPSAPPPPAYAAPQPDLSIKYNVMLGLPPDMSPDLPPAARSGDRPGEPFDGPASTAADIASSLVAEFRRKLRTCSKLPPSIAPSDRLKIKLRVFMTLEARLAAEPVLIEASASPKGPALMQAAIGALQGCQPYAMLPSDRYGEWKVLDLSFTPQDFAG
ncbi:MAG: hypothetical protein Q7J60_08220, partial [Bradyrhizobium sp.]|nr:hypothetical protein [Bradyrhizobium sp.]